MYALKTTNNVLDFNSHSSFTLFGENDLCGNYSNWCINTKLGGLLQYLIALLCVIHCFGNCSYLLSCWFFVMLVVVYFYLFFFCSCFVWCERAHVLFVIKKSKMQTNNNNTNQFNTSEAKKHQLFLVLYTFQIQNRNKIICRKTNNKHNNRRILNRDHLNSIV